MGLKVRQRRMRQLVWFRGEDLRLADHPALDAARGSTELICLFILEPHYFAPQGDCVAPHRLQFLLDALDSLANNLKDRGSELLIVPGPATRALPSCVERWKPERVLAQQSVLPGSRRRDRTLAAELPVELRLFGGQTLLPPGSVRNGSGGPYAVFSAFARAVRKQLLETAPLPSPRKLPPAPADLDRTGLLALPELASLGATNNAALQRGGERAARQRLRAFLAGPSGKYDVGRDRMDQAGTSRLSADLKFGTLSVRTVHARVCADMPEGEARTRYLNELLWREFSHHTLHDRPELLHEPFRAGFRGFPWRDDRADLAAWEQGQTGYPVVDAAMRQLLAEGFVHNRARMIAASFLCKHLLVDYRHGERHYMQWLTDGCPAQNNMGWQWSSGSGCDAQPYFRVFNPMTQGKRFDPDGAYVRRYVPELHAVPTKHVHAPWMAPEPVLAEAGVRLGQDYPHPIVDHATARARFLETARVHLGPPPQ